MACLRSPKYGGKKCQNQIECFNKRTYQKSTCDQSKYNLEPLNYNKSEPTNKISESNTKTKSAFRCRVSMLTEQKSWRKWQTSHALVRWRFERPPEDSADTERNIPKISPSHTPPAQEMSSRHLPDKHTIHTHQIKQINVGIYSWKHFINKFQY